MYVSGAARQGDLSIGAAYDMFSKPVHSNGASDVEAARHRSIAGCFGYDRVKSST